MSTLFDDSVLAAALWIAIRASVLLGFVAVVDRMVRRRASAAVRHFLWTIAISSVLLLPAAALTLPAWNIVVRTVPAATSSALDESAANEPVAPPISSQPLTSDVNAVPAAAAPVAFSWDVALLTAYTAGVCGMLLHLIAAGRSARRFVRRAAVVTNGEWVCLLADCADRMNVRRPVRLLRSRERNVPIALGTFSASIVVPAVADAWETDRRRAVLLHELAHVARFDCLTQTLAMAACAIYWFHPLAWFAARRLRVERELACDDKVIRCGTEGREYASHLLEIAYSFGNYRAPALAVGMARHNQLEGRMIAALDAARNRSVPPIPVRVAYATVAAVLLVTVAALTPTTAVATATTQSAAGSSQDLSPSSFAATSYSVDGLLRTVNGPLKERVRRLIRRTAAAFGVQQANLPGTWEIRPANTEGMVHLRLVEINSSTGSNIRIDQLEGLTAAQLSGAGGPVQFRIRRDAGTFTFEGVMRSGVGAGTFSFILHPNFAAEMAKRGFARPSPEEQYELARHDIGYAFVEELTKQGYAKPQTSDLVRAGQHGVHLTYLQEMGALGYRLGSLDPLITLRDHGVSPSYVRALAEQGYKGLTADELRNARDHGVSPEYVRAMREAGYGALPMKELINARDHGVSAEFVRGLSDAGHGKLPLDELVRVRDHGVSAEYAREMRQLGHTVPIAELVNARDHGVSVEYVREMEALGYSKLPMAALIRLRDHGVSAEYARALKGLGYDRLTPDDLITLRDHGLTAERIRAANARAGSRLPIDMLKSLAAGGMR